MINEHVLERYVSNAAIRQAWLDSIHDNTMMSDYRYWVMCYEGWTRVSGTYSVDKWMSYIKCKSLLYRPEVLTMAHDAVESFSQWLEANADGEVG